MDFEGTSLPQTKAALERLLAQAGWGGTLPRMTTEPAGEDEAAVRPGTITEIVPDAEAGASGVTSMALAAAARTRGRIAWLDTGDGFDPASAAQAGVELERLLWLRGGTMAGALQAAQMMVQAGGFGLVVLDFLDVGPQGPQIPRAAWFRLLRGLERERRTALLTLTARPRAGACASRVVAVNYERQHWNAAGLAGAQIGARVATTRRDPGREMAAQRWSREFAA